jgi:hypothetical protein
LVRNENSNVQIVKNGKDLIEQISREPDKTITLWIVVPGNSLERMWDACVSIISKTNRIVAYFEAQVDIKRYIQNSAVPFNRKLQYCLTQNLESVLSATVIDSILSEDGPLEKLSLKEKFDEKHQRNAGKKEGRRPVKILLKFW